MACRPIETACEGFLVRPPPLDVWGKKRFCFDPEACLQIAKNEKIKRWDTARADMHTVKYSG